MKDLIPNGSNVIFLNSDGFEFAGKIESSIIMFLEYEYYVLINESNRKIVKADEIIYVELIN